MSLDRSVFAQGMSVLSEIFGKEVTEYRADVYYRVLEHLSDDAFRAAVRHIVSTKKFPVLPLPAEILEAALGDPELHALKALEKVDRALFKHGAYRSVVFDDPVIHRVISVLGGWDVVCLMDSGDWERRKREFLRMYQAFSRENCEVDNVPLRLVGVLERGNLASGFPGDVPQPVYVGDKETAIAWTKALEEKALAEGQRQKVLAEGVRPSLEPGGSSS